MFAELERVMDVSVHDSSFFESLKGNVVGKKSTSGVLKTSNFLKSLYGFDLKLPSFIAFRYFWLMAEPKEKPLIAFLYAIKNDYLLQESIQVVRGLQVGQKASIELFEEEIEKNHPNNFSLKTRKSIAQNIASSWKQAGFIEGKVKNIRIQPEVTYRVACFAFLLAYINGDRGDFIWGSIVVNALCLYESKLRELAIECAKKDLMQYQYAGSVTAINFTNLLNKIGINGNTN